MPLRTDTDIHVLGVRHHGPGSARAVERVLRAVRPDAVVIEGPPELDALLPLAGSDDLVPPVAALVYATDEPRKASFYPFASFSPEWLALRWSLAQGVAVRFADLAATHYMDERNTIDRTKPVDAIGLLAEAAGYDEPERWWEDAVEHRAGPRSSDDDPIAAALAPFDAISEAIAQIRVNAPPDPANDRREAAMRRVIRQTVSTGAQRIVIVCGAWHAPALQPDAFPTIATDNARLKGLRKRKVAATWAPWTARRLTFASGYGAGVTSPGWYAHAFAEPGERLVESWMVLVARALRRAGYPAPSAMVIDASRLARTLAVLRGRPAPGLLECTDAVRATLTAGSDVPLSLITDEVVIGKALGRIPPDAPLVPLAADLDAARRSARLKVTADPKTITVDLRQDAGLRKSTLLHRLRLLDIGWGREVDAGSTTGTFKEAWTLVWEPELEVAVIEASVWGTTIEAAAEARAEAMAEEASSLAALTSLLRRCVPAALPSATAALAGVLESRAATQQDGVSLMEATEPLAEACRYGTVRRLDMSELEVVLSVMVKRSSAALDVAVRSLDDDGAARLRAAIDALTRAVSLLEAIDRGLADAPEVDPAGRPTGAQLRTRWLDAIFRVADRDAASTSARTSATGIHSAVAGRLDRLLLDAGRIPPAVARDRLSRRLSTAADAPDAAAYLDAFLEGDATLLLMDDALLGCIDDWVRAAPEQILDDLLPLLRRTFSRYQPAERRAISQRIRRSAWGRPPTAEMATDHVLDLRLVQPAVDSALTLMGVALDG